MRFGFCYCYSASMVLKKLQTRPKLNFIRGAKRSEHPHCTCSISGWNSDFPHVKTIPLPFCYDPSGSNPLSVFIENCFGGRDGIYTLIRIRFRNSNTFYLVAVWFFTVITDQEERFSLIFGFFRSIDPRNTGPSKRTFEIWFPVWPLAFKKSSCCEKGVSGIQRQVPSCQMWPGSSITMMVLLSFLSSCGSSCYP